MVGLMMVANTAPVISKLRQMTARRYLSDPELLEQSALNSPLLGGGAIAMGAAADSAREGAGMFSFL